MTAIGNQPTWVHSQVRLELQGCISTRAVGGGVSASTGQGTPLIDFTEAMGALPFSLALFGTGAVDFSVADITSVCADPVNGPPSLTRAPRPCKATSSLALAAHSLPGRLRVARPKSDARRLRTARPNSGASLTSHLSTATWPSPSAWASPTATSSRIPRPSLLESIICCVASYGTLGESMRLSAVRRRPIMKLRDQGSFELASTRNVGESWYMDWTRNFAESPGKNKLGLAFVESKTWLLRVRFFPEKSAERLVEGLE